MGKINLLSMKGSIIGIFITLILVLTIPLLFLLSQENRLLNSKKAEPTPTPATLAFAKGEGNIAGYVYHDNNRDGKREAEEKPFSEVKIQMKILSENTNEDYKVFDSITDSYGYFNFRFPSNTEESYMVKIVVPKGYKTVESNPLIISDLTPNTEKLVEFGLIPSGTVPLTPTRKPTATPTESVSPTP
jgi:hypothetical protein